MKIAISGLSGSGNSTVCALLGKRMGLTVINYTLRNMALELGMDFGEIHKKRKDDPSFDYLLDRKQAEKFSASKNAVLGSRLAIWLVDSNLSIWLDAGLLARAGRIAKREGIPLRQAIAQTRRRDSENSAQYRKLYGINVSRHGFADMVIDTEKLPAAKVAQLIIKEAKKPKYNKVRGNKYAGGLAGKIAFGLKGVRC